jgi:RNA polymerase sigma factor (sigma-70 family)
MTASPTPPVPHHFVTTRWSLVAAAGGEDRQAPDARRALAALCEAYWYPLYAYVRRRGHDANDAGDLTQAFFARLREKNDLRLADPQRGRFRSFLLAAMNHFLANEWRNARAAKRGGGAAVLSLDLSSAETRFGREAAAVEPSHEMTAEKAFERQWALTLIGQAMAKLRAEYAAAGPAKERLFEALSPVLGGEGEASYAHTGEKLGMSEGAVKVAAHRLRKRCRELLRDEVAQTVADPAEVDEELRHLLAAVAGDG